MMIWVAMGIWAGMAWAHEVRPAIGDLSVVDGTVTLDITLNAEAIVAGVDLEGVDDTNDTVQSREVDALRALTPEELANRIRALAPTFTGALGFQADGQAIMLQLTGVAVDEIGNIALPRDTRLTLQAFVPTRTQSVALTWPAEYGTLVLRQMGVDESEITHYLGI
ncbi:MAG: HupE/UreJ family protein, partial [Primorskyibacter sp.]